MVSFYMCLLLLRSVLCRNISFQSSSLELPTSLLNPITVYYNNTLHIIPSTPNITYSTSFTMEDFVNESRAITFQSKQSKPDFWSYPISCFDNNCFIKYNNSLYIIQDSSDQQGLNHLSLLIYDMNTQTYLASSDYSHVHQLNDNATTVCVVSKQYPWGHQPFSAQFLWGHPYIFIVRDDGNIITYDITYNRWQSANRYSEWWIAPSVPRKGIGCEFSNDTVYLWGGVTEYGKEVTLGERCNLMPYNEDWQYKCRFLDESMTYPRSYFHISPILEHYLLIYGGSSVEAARNMELFDTSIDEFVMLPNHMDSLYNKQFSPLVLNSYLLAIIGGHNVENDESESYIEYMDLSQVLQEDVLVIDQQIPQCSTTYVAKTECKLIDQYLIKNIDHLIFDIYAVYGEMSMQIQPVAYSNPILISTENFEFFPPMYSAGSNNTLLQICKPTPDCNNKNCANFFCLYRMYEEIENHFTLWMKWDPKWTWGFGYNYDPKFVDMNVYSFFAEPIEDNVVMLDVQFINICNGIYAFRSDTCSLNLEIKSKIFSVGDYIHIASNWNITDATSLNVPIYIKSYDMIDIDYTMWITDRIEVTFTTDRLSVCTLCNNMDNETCVDCNEGFKVSDLKQYNVTNNVYEILVSSELNGFDDQIVIMTRIIEEVEFEIITSSILDGNETYDIYPDAEIFIFPDYNRNALRQSNGTFMIQFDPDLTFDDNLGTIFIDFYKDLCTIIYNNRTIDCYTEPIIIPSSMKFKSIIDNIYTVNISSWDTMIIGTTSFELNRYIQSLSLEFNDKLFLGHAIDIFEDVLDDKIYQNSSSVIVSNEEYDIYSIINIHYNYSNNVSFISKCEIETPIIGLIEPCFQGIQFKTTDQYIIGKHIALNISSKDTYLQQPYYKIFIEECNIGNGLIGTSFTSFACDECKVNTVNVLPNSQCISCSNINGITCLGSSNLMISYNYWVDIKDDNTIISNFCPSGYCCQNINGCRYTTTIKEELCAINRDFNTPLCGKCIEGYSEVLGSSQCQKCEDNYSYLLVPTILAMFFVLLLLMLDPPPKPINIEQNTNKETNYIRILLKDDLKGIQLCILRPLLYFFQAINFITIQTGFFFYLHPLIKILSLDVFDATTSNETGEESGICLINGMTSIQKQFWYLFFPFSMFISIAIFALINICCKYGLKKHFPFLNFGWNIVCNIFIILIGNIVSTMLKMLACSQVNDKFVHFYSGNIDCFGSVWIFALIVITAIVILWIIIGFLLYNMDEINRDSRKSYLRSVTKSYKLKYWYWELILISRRIIIAFMVTIQYIDYRITQYILLILLIIYLSLHFKLYPFNYKRANVMESLCIFLLIIALLTVVFEFHHQNPDYVAVIMTMIVIIPLLLLFTYIILTIINYMKMRGNEIVLNDLKYSKKIETWKSRLTQSQIKLFDANILENNDDEKENEYVESEKNIAVVQMSPLKIQRSSHKSIELGSLLEDDDELEGISPSNNHSKSTKL